MMPKFWKYLITTCTGSAVCLVAESDRDSVEKELENDPRLLAITQNHKLRCPSSNRSVPELSGTSPVYEPTNWR